MRVWVPRILALLALVGAAVAILLAINSVDSTDEVTGEDAQAAMRQLAVGNGALSDRLEPLSSGDSPREAQEETRNLTELTRSLDKGIDGEGDLADQLRAVYAAQLSYLDAVGSTLNNPASPLREKVGETAQALRDVLQQVPGGDHRAIRGGMALVLYSEARVSR